MSSFWERLRRRKVVEWGLAYLAAGWLAFEVAGQLADTFGWSENVARIGFVALATGFAAALVLAWYHGERGRQSVSGMEALILAGILVVGAAGVALVRVKAPSPADPDRVRTSPLDATTSSIAVLPFDNFGSDEERHFSDGISEEILNVLAQIPDLQVAARTSSFVYRDGASEITDIARALGVAYVLEGSVRRSAGTVRITAQLIDGTEGFHVWSETYDRDLTPSNIFEIQDEISRRVARELQLRVSEAALGAARFQTSDPQAHDLYLRGIAAFAEGTEESLHMALDFFEGAIRRDPNYSLAHARLAWSYGFLADAYMPGAEAYPLALQAAERALALAPDLSEALSARAAIRVSYPPWSMEEGRADADRAIELSPSSPLGYLAQALYGWWDEAYGCGGAMDAHRLDPLNPTWPSLLALCKWTQGHHREAVAAQEMADAISPDFTYHDRMVGLSYAGLGRHEEALDQFERSERFLGRPSIAHVIWLAEQGREGEARTKLRAVEQAIEGGESYVPEFKALAVAALREDEAVFEALEEGMRTGSAGATLVPSMIRLSAYSSTDRYRELARRYGVPMPPKPR